MEKLKQTSLDFRGKKFHKAIRNQILLDRYKVKRELVAGS